MKKRLYTGILVVMLMSLSILVAPTLAFAWNQSFHAYVAKKCLGLDYKYVASYNARMGSTVPDFFWYLKDTGIIDLDGLTEQLHGQTENQCVSDETTYFYDTASDLLGLWNYRLRYFTEGIATHVYADIKAHNTYDGYLEGAEKWIDALAGLTGLTDDKYRGILHRALELSVDALLVHDPRYGLQLNDLLFAYNQANFVEKVVVRAFEDEGWSLPENLDVSAEFKKYLALMRALEKLAALYAPYLIQGEVDEGALSMLEESELMELEPKLSEEGLNMYLKVLLILLVYPDKIYSVISDKWEDAVQDAVDFCKNPSPCE